MVLKERGPFIPRDDLAVETNGQAETAEKPENEEGGCVGFHGESFGGEVDAK